MSLTLRIEELSRFCVSANLGSSDGRISVALAPKGETDSSPTIEAGLLIHFETVVENGSSKLNVFTSFEEETGRATTQARSFTTPVSSHAQNLSSYTGGTAVNVEADHFGLPFKKNISNALDTFLPHFMEDDIYNPDPQGLSRSNFFEPVFRNQPDNSTIPNILGVLNPIPSLCSGKDLSQDLWFLNAAPTVNSFDVVSIPSPTASTLFQVEDNSQISSPESMASSPVTNLLKCGPNPTSESPAAGSPAGTKRARRLSCLHPGCNRRFMSEYTRKLHMGTHKPKPRFSCEMGCNETFSRQHDRLRHEVAKHGRPCEWVCKQCRRFFSCQETQNKHKCSASTSISQWTPSCKYIQANLGLSLIKTLEVDQC